jgi:Xaa-Pro aminopeptidase
MLSHNQYSLFVTPNDKKKEIWEGKKISLNEATDIFKADKAYLSNDFSKILPKLLKDISTIFVNLHEDNSINEIILRQDKTTTNLKDTLEELRVIKDKTEIKQMQRATDISVKAHEDAMRQVKKYQYEYQIAAIFDYHFSFSNVQTAYPHIVASGKNACTLHYVKNDATMQEGDLLLIDAGCEFNGYASDITRTFPINGKFSTEQKAIYNIVLDAQKQAIACIKPNVSIKQPHKITVEIITQGLIELGLLKGSIKQNIKDKTYLDFFMHGTGHFLGLDVHDVGNYKIDKKERDFEVGMAMTVEPGIYISANKNIDEKWWGIGVRIEDDIVVTTTGHHNLTQNLAKEVDDVEALMRG